MTELQTRMGTCSVARTCITSFRTTETDIHRVVDEMNRLIHQDSSKSSSKLEEVVPAQPTDG
ncbi:MAG: hypothetical protein ACRESE_05675 [Gammaproteobacteria bacterium]